jgi:hypothetical protein
MVATLASSTIEGSHWRDVDVEPDRLEQSAGQPHLEWEPQ